MKKKQDIIKEIDQAIDTMDTASIGRGLESLEAIEPLPIQIENPRLFAARIQKLDKENKKMMKPHKFMKAAVIAVAVVTAGFTVYAADPFQIFSSVQVQEDRLLTVRSTDGEEAQVELNLSEDACHRADSVFPESRDYTFETLPQAEAELGMKLVLPAVSAGLKLDRISGRIDRYEELDMESRNADITYADDKGKKLHISITRAISDTAVITEQRLEEGVSGTYQNKNQVEFTHFSENGSTVYYTAVGGYEYSLTFTGYEETELKELVDSIDLTEYK